MSTLQVCCSDPEHISPRPARVLITAPQGFERTLGFDLDEPSATITERVREAIED
jgi:hypothetical protein